MSLSVRRCSLHVAMEPRDLGYIDIQPDALAVFDDVAQGVVAKEAVWISCYKTGQSVHGKLTVTPEGFVASEVVVEREKSTFTVSASALDIPPTLVRFPRQVIELGKHIDAIAVSPDDSQLVVGGRDGYCVVWSASGTTPLVGHVSDVLDVKWFPSGEVVLTASSDFSLRIFSSISGINPRTLKGHTRAVVATHIIGVGRKVLSASKDGSVRLWNVSKGEQAGKLETGEAIEGMAVIACERGMARDTESEMVVGIEEHTIFTVGEAIHCHSTNRFGNDSSPRTISREASQSKLISVAVDPVGKKLATGATNGVIAIYPLDTLSNPLVFRRNESPILSLHYSSHGLVVGTASGLPCILSPDLAAQELAGWDAVAVQAVTAGSSVWCAGDGAVRRY